MSIRLFSNTPGELSEIIGSFDWEYENLDAVRLAIVPDLSKMSAYRVLITSKEGETREDQQVAYYHQYRIAVVEPTVVYINRVSFTNFVCAAASIQTGAETGGSTWVSTDPTSGEVACYQSNMIGLRSGVWRESISGYEALRRFGLYARSLITKQGLKVISTNIRDWASAEDPDWKQLVIDFEVEAKPDVALALWDRLNDEFRDFLSTLEGKLPSDLRDLISITVQWK